MLYHLGAAAKAANLMYKLVSSLVLIGIVAYEAKKYADRQRRGQ